MAEHISKRLKRWRSPVFCLIALTVTLVIGSDYAMRFKFFRAVEEASLNLRFHLNFLTDGYEYQTSDEIPIVIVKIDDRSLYPQLSEQELQKHPDVRYLMEPWAWNRAVHARLAERLLKAGARTVVFDLVFPGPNEGDSEFLKTIETHPGQIILGYKYLFNENARGDISVGELLPYDDLLPLEFEDMIGFANIIRDEDGAVRRAKMKTNLFAEKLAFTYDPQTYERLQQFALKTKEEYSLGVRAALSVRPELESKIQPIFTHPYIGYAPVDHFKKVSYLDVLIENDLTTKPNPFDGAIVFVGGYSDIFKDIVSTPLGDIAGVESHAHVTRSLLTDSFYERATGTTHWCILSLIATLLLFGTLFFRSAPTKGAFLFGLLIFYLLASQGAFLYLNYILPIVPILWIILLPGGLFLLYDFTIAQYERSRLQGYLGRYVSPEVAKVIAEDSSQLDALLRGANRPIVALFADIRDFTSLSEAMDPERLVEQLNEYFEVMVTIIHKRQGSLNKYIGDAILAVWGGIHSDGSQADCENAVLAALEMGDALKKLNENWAKRADREELAIGVGLSFGEGFVGNMGHSHRMEFAVMGDVVNLASRLEGATKLYDGYILANDALFKQCPDSFHFQEVDRLRVKGKALSIPVHRPAALRSEPVPSWLSDWKLARSFYLKRDFEAAEKAFRTLAEQHPEQDANASLYLERCHIYLEKPPPEGWDGTYVMTSK